MMQPLHIDFGASRQRSPWIGRVMLAVSALVALDAGLSYHTAKSTLGEGSRFTVHLPVEVREVMGDALTATAA